jgi:hypothetical protein
MRKTWICPVCKKKKPIGTFVCLSGGGYEAKIKGLWGFLHLDWHDDQTQTYASQKLAEDDKIGQFELHFCSTACLHSWFNQQIAKLHDSINEAWREMKKKKR